MTLPIGLTNKKCFNTSFAPLAVIGYCLMRHNFFDPLLTQVQVPMRTRDYSPSDKLLDCFVSIWAGCTSIQQINSRLRPDRILAQAWQRPQFAEQSTLARTLDAFTLTSVQQLRAVNAQYLHRYGRTLRHDFTPGDLWVDVDLSPLPAGRHAEASTKGYVSGKKTCMDASWCG